MHYQEIITKDNNKFRQLTKLAINKSFRYDHGLAVIYGEHLIEEALKYNMLDSVFVNKDRLSTYQNLLTKCFSKQVYILDCALLNKLKLADSTVDLVATIIIKQAMTDDAVYSQDCIILENIQDPGNLGTIMRAAVASGVENLVLSPNSVDPYNIKVLRASQGMQFALNIINSVNIIEFIARYEKQVLAAVINADKSIYTCDLTSPVAWVFGNEGSGLSPELLGTKCDKISIPMLGDTESLNVAMAATVCLFETMRQRIVNR